MKKLKQLLTIVLLIVISLTVNAQFNVSGALKKAKNETVKASQKKKAADKELKEQEEKNKDYPLLSRFDGAEKVFERTTKWEEYKLPIITGDAFLNWECYTKLEGKIIRYQYKVSPDNNPSYVLKTYKTKLMNSGFDILFAKTDKEMDLSSGSFSEKYYSTFGNSKFGFAYRTSGKDHAFIVGKIKNDGKDIYAAIYISSFDNTTLITQDIIEAETIEEHKVILSLFRGSRVSYDDKMGFDGFYVTTAVTDSGKLITKVIEGNIHHRFCYVPEGHSINELITNYEEAIRSKGGKILVSSSGKAFYKEFHKKRPDHGLTNYEWIQFGLYNNYYLSAFIAGDEFDYYVLILPAQVDKKLVYSFVIIETKPMEKGFVTAKNIDADILTKGHYAVYGIYFETGKSNIQPKSKEALTAISDFLNDNYRKKYYIVGHTDNTGDFAKNQALSEERAKAVMDELINNYNILEEQLKTYGASSLSPVENNSTEEGKAKNRRVEIVEQ